MKKQLLIVDDDREIRAAFGKVLGEAGYTILEAGDGISAMNLIKSKRIDLMLLDLQIPKMDGWEILLQLCSPRPPFPILGVTGLADQLDTKLIPGLSGLLEKPIEAELLLDVVKSTLAGIGCVGAGSPQPPELSPTDSAGYLRLANKSFI